MNYKRILIIRTDRIGDVILSTPVIQAARKAYPDAFIAFMTGPYTKDIVLGNPFLSEVILYDKDVEHKSVLATILFASRLKKYCFDLALILHSTNRVNWVAFLAGITKRVGYDRRAGWLLTDRMRYVKPQGAKHEAEYNLDVVREAGINFNGQDLRLYMPVSKEDEGKVSAFLKNNGITEKDIFFCMHINADSPSKRWPVERFAETADRIIAQTGYKAVVFAVGNDIKSVDLMKANMKSRLVLMRDFTIPQTTALLKRAKFFISPDSGPSHMAAVAGTPSVIIFGTNEPGLGPSRWRPLNQKAVILQKDAGCVEVEEVLDAAKKFF
jgi:ADP-heptose:LPS heptosyltransferase